MLRQQIAKLLSRRNREVLEKCDKFNDSLGSIQLVSIRMNN